KSFASVDFPEPLCPSTATNSPRFISRDMLLRAVVLTVSSSYSVMYEKVTFLSSINLSICIYHFNLLYLLSILPCFRREEPCRSFRPEVLFRLRSRCRRIFCRVCCPRYTT